MRKYKKENKEVRERERERKEITWFGLRGLHHRKAFDDYIFTIKLYVFYNKPTERYLS